MQTLDILSKFSTLIAALIAAGVAGYFGRVQARIAQTQARISADAVATARNKLRHDMFERRLAAYDAVTEFLNQIRGADTWQTDLTEFRRPLSVLRWLFPDEVWHWYDVELQATILDVATAQAACVGVPPGAELGEKRLAVAAAMQVFNRQYARRDAVMGPYLRLSED